MKRVMMLLAVVFAVAAHDAQAQARLQLGVTGGASISTFVGSDADGSETRTGPYFGGTLVVHNPGAMIGFETGLVYISKGASGSEDGITGEFKLQYVEVPLLLRLAFGAPGSQVRPVAVLGASVGVNTGCKIAGSAGSMSVEIDCDDSIFEGELDPESLDFGLTGGLGVDIPIGERAVLAPHVRYTRGLTDVFSDASMKNSSFQIGIAVRIAM